MKTFLTLFLAAFVLSCNQKMENKSDLKSVREDKLTDTLDRVEPTVISYDSIIDVGFISKDTAHATFNLINIGKNPLYVAAISPSCGCTSATKAPKDPIKTGDTLEVKVDIDMNRISNENFEKTVTILSNSQERVLLLRVIGKKNKE